MLETYKILEDSDVVYPDYAMIEKKIAELLETYKVISIQRFINGKYISTFYINKTEY